MIDVERGSKMIDVLQTCIRNVVVLKKHKMYDRLQNRDVEAWNTLFSTLEACGSIME